MADLSDHRLPSALAFSLALASTVALAVLWHMAGLAPHRAGDGYALSRYVAPVSWGYVVAYALLALLLGRMLRRSGPVALGMIVVLPIATAIEIVRDPTSHNLIPFEGILLWAPAFAIAFGCAFIGRTIASRVTP